jgi:hypothetical protein
MKSSAVCDLGCRAFADPIISLPPDAFRKREPVHLRSAITGKIGSPVTIRQTHDHNKNIIGTIRIQLCAKSFILQMYDILESTSSN